MNQTTIETGRVGEDLAQKYLSSIGYKILERNWRWRKCEIDIIATHEDRVVFIEVKTRGVNNIDQGDDVSFGQRKRIINAANSYLLKNWKIHLEPRFDLVRVRKTQGYWWVDHLREAFEVV